MKYRRIILQLVIMITLFAACRKQWSATEQDMANYGWNLYEQGDYVTSYEWFTNSIIEDKNFQDGYNGLGWTFGKLVELDSAVQTFATGLSKPSDDRNTTNVSQEILAGLTFAHSALKKDSSVILYGDSLIWLINQQIGEKTWSFSHDSTTNYLDVHVMIALSYYALSDYDDCIANVQAIKTALNPASPPYIVNTATVRGREELAAEIEFLQNYLRNR